MEKVDLNCITKENFEDAIIKYDENLELCENRKNNYTFLFKGKEYSHKCLVGIAYNISKGVEGVLDHNDYYSIGGKKSYADFIIHKFDYELYEDVNFENYLSCFDDTNIDQDVADIKNKLKMLQKKSNEQNIVKIVEEKKDNDPLLMKYFNFLNKSMELTIEQIDMLEKIADDYNLESHYHRNTKKWLQIYPKICRDFGNEGTGGTHYEFFINKLDGCLSLTLHIEHKSKYKKDLNLFLGKESGISKKCYKNTKEVFAEFYNKYENKIEEFYSRGEDKMKLGNYLALLEYQKQIILQGPPGTGKTRLAKQIAISMINKDSKIDNNVDIKREFESISKDRIKLIQFHPSFSYEDFVRGIVAKTESNGIVYVTKNKILADMAEKAKEEWDKVENKKDAKPYILIIDEINRANLSSVLGELIYALEYRDEPVESMYERKGSREIILPSNLYIIGTMNTADRSIGHIDYAIRRRFSFESVLPNETIVEDKLLFEKVKSLFKKYEDTRADTLSPEFNADDVMLGHSYFMGDVNSKLQYQIQPLLKEYVKDGVLNESAIKIIENLKISNTEEN